MSRTIVAVGEALWDVFPDRRLPGGAPCNVAYHAARLGERGVIVTRVGADAAGDELVGFLRDRGIATDYVQRDRRRPTGTVRVTGTAREPRFTITPDVAWDHLTAPRAARALVRSAAAVCVGTLAQRGERSRTAIQRLLADARGRALVVVDVNLRPPFVDPETVTATFRAADVVKASEVEVARLSALLDRRDLVAWLLHEVGVRAVCVTRGPDGASLATAEVTVSARGIAVDTARGDPVGAGDAFTAAITRQLVRGAAPEPALHLANRYAALVAARRGAMPDLGDEELSALEP